MVAQDLSRATPQQQFGPRVGRRVGPGSQLTFEPKVELMNQSPRDVALELVSSARLYRGWASDEIYVVAFCSFVWCRIHVQSLLPCVPPQQTMRRGEPSRR